MALVPPHDVLLLNSDTAVPQRRGRSWLDRLRAAVHAAPDIGSATPLSNDATILSYPERDRRNPPPDPAALARLDAIAARVNAGAIVDIPTGIGFCLYLRHECLAETGLFRPELFAQGYGEENDLCIRAHHLGWRHIAVPGVVVAHRGGASFGHAAKPLVERNLAVLERLHPGYHALIAAYKGGDPTQDLLAPARLALDAARFAEARKTSAVIIITHDSSGGVERVVRARCRTLTEAGHRPVVLRPVPDPDPDSTEATSLPGLCRVSDGPECSHPNLVYRLPQDLPALSRLLRAEGAVSIEVHHRLGHHPSVMMLAERLKLPVDLHLHDYAAFCPRITLTGPEGRYCGEPEDAAICESCVADLGSRLEESLPVTELRARSAREIAAARHLVVPSHDMAGRLRRHFPHARPEIVALENDLHEIAATDPPDGSPRHVCVIGAIGVEKGYDVLLACARDAARRDLGLRFTLAGHSTDDARLEATGRVFITGRYDDAEACDLIRSLGADLAFLPSIWPETWGFTLGLAWRSALPAMVFDIGAMAVRVRATGLGWVLPLALGPTAINNLLISPPKLPRSPGS
jgi:glycosyltransferase involved in cell wall biosynthesis